MIALSPVPNERNNQFHNIYDEERKTFYKTFGAKKFFDAPSTTKRNTNISISSSEGLVKSPKQQFEEFK